MKVLILGIDGYIGYALAQHLSSRGDEVCGVDNLSRRERVEAIKSDSLTPIKPYYKRCSGKGIYIYNLHMDYVDVRNLIMDFSPDVIVHLAEQPSAPYSMINPLTAIETQTENIIGTLNLLWIIHEINPNIHIVKIGTMGEYGTPNCDIPEGKIPEVCCISSAGPLGKCPMSGLLFPRQAGSFYHLSKVHDTHNIEFACRNWGLRSTDIMQGVVYGLNDDTEDLTRFDYDQYFGTAINRFCAQAISNHPLTVYGSGSQVRGFLTLQDSIQCLTIAIDNPPEQGEYRTWNQYEDLYSIEKLATLVSDIAYERFNIPTNISYLPNPRNEADKHYYNPTCKTLYDLGYVPSTDIRKNLINLIEKLIPFKDRVIKEVIMPTTTWR